ncbi:penicillin-binding transpeptidase domain-containing protein [Streptomyces sp. DK15]|uniref:peptidoglycan D,D-transpeptidase FtsI family protein n=1 Tax=Streptomyces sp. DK15 TaxID=2957499 RepID=UPI0029ACA204|nr:penicillin-binding transpeptidase domain-containing protein [Streptomyces sp. DK15]MDX2395217.1 penicillin-binding transpeptidase domain-containing protein [Streptomyces sp. DK15]
MNKTLRHASVFFGVLFFALLGRATWIHAVSGESLAKDPNNRRNLIEAFSRPRGDIIVGGRPITGSIEIPGSELLYKRTYSDGPMYAPVTGYLSQAHGATMLEGVHRAILAGTDPRLHHNVFDALIGEKTAGGNIVTTIDPDAQKAAYKGLTDLGAKGAVVALDPRSGKILAMASTPSYDPSVFAGNSHKEGEEFTRLDADKAKPLSNRAIREAYPSGSTFKLLTAAAALEHGTVADINAPSNVSSPYQLPDSSARVPNVVPDAQCDKVSMKTAMQWSCNNVFLDAALKTGVDRMRETAEKFGFNQEHFLPIRTAAATYPDKLDKPQTALTGIGQGSLTSTPMQMAMVAAGIANNGTVMKPYLVEQIQAPDLSVVDKTAPQAHGQAVSERTAKKVQDMMEHTVREGSANGARIEGVTVGAKPGTAEHGLNVDDELPYAWFVSYAKQKDGTSPVAVAVFIDPKDMNISPSNIGGGRLGAPIAKAVMNAILQ